MGSGFRGARFAAVTVKKVGRERIGEMSNQNTKNFHADLGKAFTSDAVTVVFGRGKFVMDFKKTAPRIDRVNNNQNQTIVSEHQPIVIRPEAAKMLLRILENNVERYEEEHGEIEIPESQSTEDTEEAETASTDQHGYIG